MYWLCDFGKVRPSESQPLHLQHAGNTSLMRLLWEWSEIIDTGTQCMPVPHWGVLLKVHQSLGSVKAPLLFSWPPRPSLAFCKYSDTNKAKQTPQSFPQIPSMQIILMREAFRNQPLPHDQLNTSNANPVSDQSHKGGQLSQDRPIPFSMPTSITGVFLANVFYNTSLLFISTLGMFIYIPSKYPQASFLSASPRYTWRNPVRWGNITRMTFLSSDPHLFCPFLI